MKERWGRLVRSIEIPFDPLDEKSNQANIISSLINLALLILVSYLIVIALLRGMGSLLFLVMGGMAVVLLVSRVAVHRGKTRAASIILVVFLWSSVTAIFLLLENGLRAPAYLAVLLFFIVYVGLMHGRRFVIILSALSLGVNLAVGTLELKGVFLTEPKIPDIRYSLIAMLIFIPAVAFMVTRTLRNLRLSISLYREEAEMHRRSEENVRELHQDLEAAYTYTLEGWARALELKDKETEGHSRRVTELTIKLAEKLHFSEDEIRFAYYGALLHDIGKMGIPDEILNKQRNLTPAERKIIVRHPVLARNLLKDIEYLHPAIAIPYSHHECWDGTGYPQGLRGEAIPLSARIFSVVDAWDALTSDRPYRKAWSKRKAAAYLRKQSGKRFDPQVGDVFLKGVVAGDY